MKQYFAALLLAFLALVAAPASAQTFPENNGSPVVDQAGILRPEQVFDLKSKSEALYAQTGRAFAVATVKSLEGYPIDDYAYRLGRHWKLGSAKEDDGVLLLAADAAHDAVLIESFIPGREYALEGVLDQGVLRTFAIFEKPDPLDLDFPTVDDGVRGVGWGKQTAEPATLVAAQGLQDVGGAHEVQPRAARPRAPRGRPPVSAIETFAQRRESLATPDRRQRKPLWGCAG